MKNLIRLVRLILIILTILSILFSFITYSPIPLATLIVWFFLGRHLINDSFLRKFIGALIIGLSLTTTYFSVKFPGYRPITCCEVLNKYLETKDFTKAITKIGECIEVQGRKYLINETTVEVTNSTVTVHIPILVNKTKYRKSITVDTTEIDIGKYLNM